MALLIFNPGYDLSFLHQEAQTKWAPQAEAHASDGTFSFGSLFSSMSQEASREKEKEEEEVEEVEEKPEARLGSVGADPWGAGRDLPSLLQQVSLKGHRDPGGVFSDDMGSLPRRRLDLFSSLRLRKREVTEGDGKEQEVQKEIRTILTNLRNKGQRPDSTGNMEICV